jgi:hypothetical protein
VQPAYLIKLALKMARGSVISFLLITAISATSADMALRPNYDGHWWNSIAESQREAFLNGHGDCYRWEMGSQRSTRKTFAQLSAAITSYYREHPGRLGYTISSVLVKTFELKKKPIAPPGVEVWTEKHAFYDGLFWADSTNDERGAFVSGFVACYEHFAPHKAARLFKQNDSFYAQRISQWYEKDASKEPTKIADVLMRICKIASVGGRKLGFTSSPPQPRPDSLARSR